MAGLFDGFEGHRVLANEDTDRALTSALVAVDANVLLNLYRYNVQTTNDLLAVFEKLGDRLVLPYWYSTQNSLGKAIAAAGFKASKVNLTDERALLVRRQRGPGSAPWRECPPVTTPGTRRLPER